MKTYRIYYFHFDMFDQREFTSVEQAKAAAKWAYQIVEA